jgi:hypothetical protein
MTPDDLQAKLNDISNDQQFQRLFLAVNRLKVIEKRMRYLGQVDQARLIREKLDTMKSQIDDYPQLKLLIDKIPSSMQRTEVIQRICKALRAQTYLEIGVRYGDCFTEITVPHKIAIDPVAPQPRVEAAIKKDGVSYYQMYSDDFFKQNAALFKTKKIDVAFVDGLHTYDQSLRDALNCLDNMSEHGVLVMHDCNPDTEAMGIPAPREEQAFEYAAKNGLELTGGWMGDVWKSIVYLRSQRLDLYVCTLRCDWGIGIAMKGRPESHLAFSPKEIDALTYQDLDTHREDYLNLKDQEFLFDFITMMKKRDFLDVER